MIMDTEQARLLTGSLRELFAGAGAGVPRRLRELGWDDVTAEDPGQATTLLFTEKGRAMSPAPLLDEVMLPLLAAGVPCAVHAVCYPCPGSGTRPSSTAETTTGILLRRPEPDQRIVIPFADADGTGLAVGAAGEFTVTPLPSLDREIGWHAASGPTPGLRYGKGVWDAAVPAAHRALSAEIIGVAQRALDLAVEHTCSRVQFNAPIAAFQAVRHRLADAYVAIAAARALLEASFADGSAVAASAAKARAGRAHETVSASAVQVCGAMGVSREHPLHRYVNRGAVLDGLLGSSAELTLGLGALVRGSLRSGADIPLLVEV
jgi:hypothetical protein